jgi:hypothetical protein
MTNITFSLNIENFKRFINDLNIKNLNDIEIFYTFQIEEIIYNKILLDLHQQKNKLVFKTHNIIFYDDNEKEVNIFIEDKNLIELYKFYNDIKLTKNIIKNENMNIIKYNKISLVKDKIFDICIKEKLIDKNFDKSLEWNILIKDEVLVNDKFKLISIDSKIFYIELKTSYNNLNNEIIENLIYIIELISGKNYIIEDDLLQKNLLTYIGHKLIFKQTRALLLEDLIEKINYNYCCFEKTDGLRCYVINLNSFLFYKTISENNFLIPLYDFNDNFVVDCEFYENKFYIFNLINFNNINIENYSLQQKLQICKDIFIKYPEIFIIKNPIYFNLDNKKEDFFNNLYNHYLSIKKIINIDGLIFQPILSNNFIDELILYDYKWKPENETSLDFFIKLENDNIIFIYNKRFKEISLYGYDTNKSQNNEIIKFITKSFIEIDNENNLFTLNNEIITDQIVIEFLPNFLDIKDIESRNIISVINNNINWIPFRIRYDKTEQIRKFNQKHGNSVYVIKNTIEYLNTPIKLEYFKLLGINSELAYINLQNLLVNKKVYTKINSNFNKILDYIKTYILTTFSRIKQDFEVINICELNCQNGRDLLKIYLFGAQFNISKKTFYTGFNKNNLELISNINGAISRYENFKNNKKYPNFFKFDFIYLQEYNKMDTIFKNKFDFIFIFNYFIYQNSLDQINEINKTIDYISNKNNYIFLIIYNKSILDTFISINVDKTINSFKRKIILKLSFNEILLSLDDNSEILKYLINKETGFFLREIESVFKVFENKEIFNDIFFVVLK